MEGNNNSVTKNKNAIVVGNDNSVGTEFGTAYGVKNKVATATFEGTDAEAGTALGYNNQAWGLDTTAVGANNEAAGNHSIALGSHNNAFNPGHESYETSIGYRTAIGSYNEALYGHALAIGSGISVKDASTQRELEFYNSASKEYANAIGFLNQADGINSIALGSGLLTNTEQQGVQVRYNKASGERSIALGNINTVSGTESNAVGYSNQIYVEQSNAFGSQNYVTRKNSIAIGVFNNVDGTNKLTSPSYEDAKDTTASDFVENESSEDTAISIGYYNTTYGNRSVALGFNSQAGSASGEGYNIAIGSYAKALSDAGIAIGRKAGTNGPAAMAIGLEAKTRVGYYGIALGGFSLAEKDGAIAIGGISKATGKNSVAIGYRSQTTEENTVSFGGYKDKDGTTLTRRLTNLSEGTDSNDATTVKQMKDAISSAASSIKVTQGSKEKTLQEAVTSIDSIIGTGTLDVKDSSGQKVTDLTSAANAINAKAEANAKNIGTISKLNDALKDGDNTNLVTAINKAYEAGSDASGKIGTMTDLKTDQKDTLVNAINEVKGNVGTLGELKTTEKDSLVSAVNEVKGTADKAKGIAETNANNIGTMSELASGLKNDGGPTTLVEAINQVYNTTKTESNQTIKEVDKKVEKNTQAIGDINELQTQSKTLVGAVNEVNDKVGDLDDLNEDIKKSNPMARSANDVESVVDALNIVDDKVNTTSGAIGDVKDLDADIRSDTVVGATNNLNRKVDHLGSRLNKVGAGAAALAALHPLDYDPDDKFSFAAGFGNYGGENAIALGAFYRPNEEVMFNIGGNMGNGENMINAGVSFALGSGSNHSTTSKAAMAKKLAVQDEEIADLHAKLEEEQAKNAQQNERIEKLEALVQQLARK